MRVISSIFLIAISVTLTGTATLERSEVGKAGIANPAAMSVRNIGSWKDYSPDSSGWIEVDPATGKPLIKEVLPMTNLQAKPQMPAEAAI